MTVRIASYNVRNGRAPDWSSLWWRRRAALAAVLREVDADVWGIQEVFPMQRRWLGRVPLRGHELVGSGRNRRRVGEGLYVAARRDRVAIEEVDVRWLGDAPRRPGSKLAGAGFPRIVVLAGLRVGGRPFLLADVHLDEKSSERRRSSLHQLAGWLEGEARGRPTVVLGDFNAETPSNAFDPLRDLGLSPALGPAHGGTSHGFHRKRPRQIDNVWLSPEWSVDAARVWHEAGVASDHDPVVVDLTLT